MNALTVAICEDDVDDERRLVDLVERSPVPSRAALYSEADAFVEDFTPGIYDLILMDIFLGEDAEGGSGEPEGLRAIRRIRAVDLSVPVAFVTTSKDFALEAFRLDVARYIEKPVTQAQVDDVLSFAMGMRDHRRASGSAARATTSTCPSPRSSTWSSRATTCSSTSPAGEW